MAAGDYLIHDPPVLDPDPVLAARPFTSIEELTARLSAFRAPGARAHRALHCHPGGESRPESLRRLLLAASATP